ncbi:hypothetical protein [Dysgonomonas sp. ZJ279]|uniref:hypothetical protein n=1 Tax=Dysgonomonas sp. ZJ279 TaxID=2709796 RepID=UPI0013EDFF8E|nr:hypothetical protein [Dysgonomonas sp. ZJ279]
MAQLEFNKRIVEEIQRTLPEGITLATVLLEALPLGKESVYRRLRGEVSFSLEETALLSRKFNFSMDKILNYHAENVSFNLDAHEPHFEVELYTHRLSVCINFFKKMTTYSDSEARYALNTLPFVFYLECPHLSRFQYFKWLHQLGKSSYNTSYNEVVIPPTIFELQKQFVREAQNINSSVLILDQNVFTSLQYDIEYFYQLQLISGDDLQLIKQEILDLIGYVEDIAESGTYSTGEKFFIYLSNINIEASYSHFQYADNQYAHLRLYGISGVDTQSAQSCEKQKEWIDSIRRHSTLISASGQVYRYEYFRKQRESVNSMGNIL